MNCLSHATSNTWHILRRTNLFSTRTALYGCSSPSWKSNFGNASLRVVFLDSLLSRFRFQCYSSRKGTKSTTRSRKLDTKSIMEPEKEEFFVVRKGDIVGVYKSWSDCQAQVGSSICDPPVNVFKGHSLPKDAEEYLASQGLKNAIYTIGVADMKKEIFGSLVPCTFHDEDSRNDETLITDTTKKRSSKALGLATKGESGLSSISSDTSKKHVKLDDYHSSSLAKSSSDCVSKSLAEKSCSLEFDGASKGNPGPAGAGAVLRAHDGSVISRLRQGLGIATNNVAEYRAMLLGLKYALKKGFTKIQVQGDSKLVCMQVQGLWKVKNQNMLDLCKEASELKEKFLSFQISHVLRGLNSEADAQANLAISLAEGQVQEEFYNKSA